MRANLLANYGAAALIAAMQVLLIPLYVRGLGEHDWGVLSALLAVSNFLLILEAGVSLAVARQFSGRQQTRDTGLGVLLALERRYAACIALLLVLGFLLSGPLGRLFMREAGSDSTALLRTACIMAGCQIIGSLYRSVLVGLGEQLRLNVLLVAFTAARHIGAIACIYVSGAILAVAFIFAFSAAAEALARRWVAVSAIRRTKEIPSGSAMPVVSDKGAGGALLLALAGAIGALGTQIDRVFLSATISAVDVGHYAIGATLSLAALQLLYPLSNALLPSLGRFADDATRRRMLRRTFASIAALLLLVWAGAATLASGLLALWLTSAALAAAVLPIFLLHLAGTSLNALCVPLYMSLLAHRMDGRILSLSASAVGIQILTLTITTPAYGSLAGGIAWISANAFLLTSYFYLHVQIPDKNDGQTA